MNRLAFLLLIVLAGAGCGRPHQKAVHLPLARHALQVADTDPRSITVTIDPESSLWLNGQRTDLPSLAAFSSNSPDTLLSVRIDQADSYSHLAPLLALNSNGTRQVSLRVTIPGKGEKGEWDVFFRYNFLARQENMSNLIVRLKGDLFVVDDQPLDRKAFEKTAARFGLVDRHLPLVLVPDPSNSVQSLVDALDICISSRLDNVLVSDQPLWERVPTEAGTPR